MSRFSLKSPRTGLVLALAALTLVPVHAQRPVRDPVVGVQVQVGQIFEISSALATAVDRADQAERRVTVRFDVLEAAGRAAARVAIPVAGGEVVVSLTHFEAQAGGFFTAGPLVGVPGGQLPDGEATFTVVGDTLVGRIVSGDRLFLVRRAAGLAMHTITEIDQASFPPESQPIEVPASEMPRGEARLFDAPMTAGEPTYVDLLILYTPTARSQAGSTSAIQAEIVGAVNNGNLALQNAGVAHRYRLAYLGEIAYTEGGTDVCAGLTRSGESLDLCRLQSTSDGYLDTVHSLRTQYGADDVTLIRSSSSSGCGIGYVMNSASVNSGFAPFAFNVTMWNCANGNLSMAHEIGHNLGLHHNREDAGGGQGAYDYAYGYRAGTSRDVMSYNGGSGYTRREIYSTPLFNFPTTSTPAGTATEDNARALSQTMAVAATFYSSSVSCSFTVSPTVINVGRPSSTGSITVTAASGNPTGCSWTAVSNDTSMVTITSGSSGTGSGTVGYAVGNNAGPARSANLTIADQTVTINQASGCSEASISPASASFTRAGGTGAVALTIASACGWSASSDSNWVTITSGSSGMVSGNVNYSVAANTGAAARTATLTIFHQDTQRSFPITQTGTRLTPTPASLRFSAIKNGAAGAITSVTDPQSVTLVYDGAAATTWTVSADQPWVQIAGGSGTGSGSFTVSIVNDNNVLGASTNVTATITVTANPVVGNAPVTVPVSLTIQLTPPAAASPPFGQIDTPAQNATGVQGALGVTGWTLDNIGVTGVKIYRNCLTFENAANCQTLLGQSVVFIGDAAFLAGARPDVEAAFPTMPQSYRAGWGMQVLTTMLPHVPSQLANGGQGAMTFYAFATDEEGNTTLLGRTQADSTPTSVTLANDTIAKPFGTIDTPGQGGTVSGTIANFGWVLTPDSNTTADATDIFIATNGSTMTVFIDGVATAQVAYNQCRGNVGNPVPAGVYCNDDIASIFGHATPQPVFTSRSANATRYRNLDAARAAIGAYNINTTTLSNGMHTIAWGVTDSAGRAEGIGSRFFTVLNTGGDQALPDGGRLDTNGGRVFRPGETADPASILRDAPAQVRGLASSLDGLPATLAGVTGRRGFDLSTPFSTIEGDANGVGRVTIPELGRFELQVGAVTKGYLVANGTLRDLPPGSHLDLATGRFTWVPGPGYVGTYRLVFVSAMEAGSSDPAATFIDVTIRPPVPAAAGQSEIRMHVDTARLRQGSGGQARQGQGSGEAATTFVVAGWALDPEGFTGSGIAAVHVWARRLDVPTVGSEFLGAATLGVARPDVAVAFGAGYHHAGYQLNASLAPGLYDVTVYAWNHRTARWEDARTVRVTAR